MPTTGAPRPVSADQVTLTHLVPGDAPALLELETRNRRQLLVGAPAREESWFTEVGQRTAIAHALAEQESGRGLSLAIRLEEDGQRRVVGRLTLAAITRGAFESASLGYWVDHALTGRGIATHAVASAVAVAFGGLGLHRLQAEVQVGNDASARVLEKCGFAEYGIAPDYLRLGGGWADCRLFQLVDSRWRPRETQRPGTERNGRRPGETTLGAQVPGLQEALALYDAVGWSAYTEDPAALERSLAGSAHVVTARRDGELVGLARVLSDRATVAYLQDVLVHPDVQRAGLGARLVDAALEPFAAVRQQVLLTDAEPGQRAFYESLGFVEAHDHEAGLRSFVRLR
ncbi:GNAT family N-acetyltransferase [Brachybacterium sp. AOP43-C2-M15]|uniref:GNAT family N-acetyltransferase n=1 Tax=Brachybacterium sp. AOP43-C2-M15 TaxID=3457661 RepID=UPI004033CD8F